MCSLEWWTIRYYIRIFVIFNILKWHTRALCWWGPQFWNFYMLTTQRYIKLFVIRVTSRNCRQHWIWRKKSSDNSDKWLLRLNIDKCKSVSYCIKQSTDTWLPYYGQKSVIGWSWGFVLTIMSPSGIVSQKKITAYSVLSIIIQSSELNYDFQRRRRQHGVADKLK